MQIMHKELGNLNKAIRIIDAHPELLVVNISG
jgi:hypothetical protein